MMTNSYHLMNYVVQNNQLLNGKFRIIMPNGKERPLTMKELLTLKQFISLIDTENPHIYIELSKKDNIKFLHAHSNSKLHRMHYTRCQEYCNNLAEAYFILGDTKLKVFSKMKWDKNYNYIGYAFTREMFDYLAEQKSNFTVYQIGYLKKLKSINAIKLYEYLKMNIHRNQKKSWKWTTILDYLREMLDIEDKYLETKIFFRDFLKPALKEINRGVSMDITARYSYNKETKKLTFSGKNSYIQPDTEKNVKKLINTPKKENNIVKAINTPKKENNVSETKTIAVTSKKTN